MAGRWKPYTNGPGAIQQPDYSPNDADREWVTREIGDCDFEPFGLRLQKNYTTGENHSSQLGCAHIGETYNYQLPGPYLP